jgi:hypothetical protein
MIGRIEFNSVQQKHHGQANQAFKGITPEFFGPPGPADRAKDMKLCQHLGIDTQGMDREHIKASILSKLTGKPEEQMLEFYTSVGEMDMRKDLHALKGMGIEPSAQPNNMMARAENKANIVNAWMQGNDPAAQQTDKAQNLMQQQGPEQAKGQKGKKPGGPPPLPDSIISIFNTLGLSPSGDKNSDYAAVMSKLDGMKTQTKDGGQIQYIENLKQTFIAAFSSL